MSEQSELRSRREERMENGVKNLLGAKPSQIQLLKNHGFGDPLIGKTEKGLFQGRA
jgi:hypothetical protein